MIDRIRSVLAGDARVRAWSLGENREQLSQLFTSFGEKEAIRAIDRTTYSLTVYTRPNGGGEDQQGSSAVQLLAGDPQLEEKIQRGIERAALQRNPVTELPEPGAEYPDFNDSDPRIVNDPWNLLEELNHRLDQVAASESGIAVNGSEFFLKHTHRRLVNSKGLDLEQENTSLLWDVVLLNQAPGADTEFWHIYEIPGSNYFDLESDFRNFARYARDAAVTREPVSGVCPVVLTGDALFVLYQYLVFHSAAQSKYQGSALFTPGEPILKSEPRGDRVTMYSNAVLPGGTLSYRFDSLGSPGQRVKIIDDGVLTRYWATKEYADLLKVPATGRFANYEFAPGSLSWEEMFRSDDRVIFVVQFSSFDPQPVVGGYLGEIRVGYEYRSDGSVIPIRGGSVSGSLPQGLLDCRFCKETATYRGYFGPRGIRFESARIAGS